MCDTEVIIKHFECKLSLMSLDLYRRRLSGILSIICYCTVMKLNVPQPYVAQGLATESTPR